MWNNTFAGARLPAKSGISSDACLYTSIKLPLNFEDTEENITFVFNPKQSTGVKTTKKPAR
ncbi:MAG: hypothetical protein CVU14_02130 [Bacteroidetes bacterium HGW-Bacteroidetes-9]|jgi:hypothetical protein|nr:MAG: hypothetical protein CVU14_02130 [Bacteroidetes bacterium HGW-Bacteroidetes-9]